MAAFESPSVPAFQRIFQHSELAVDICDCVLDQPVRWMIANRRFFTKYFHIALFSYCIFQRQDRWFVVAPEHYLFVALLQAVAAQHFGGSLLGMP